MITPTAATPRNKRKLPENRLPRDKQGPAEPRARRDFPASKQINTVESEKLLKEELDTVRREYAKLQQAIFEAAQVQRRLCSPREFSFGDFEIAGEIFPARHLSGDFFKVLPLDSGLGLTVGDIAGKGLSAGIWQAYLMDLIQRSARIYPQPADAVASINRDLCQDKSEPPIAALFFARLDLERSELVYCNAGLPPPLLLRRNNSIERLENGGPMVGALQAATYNSGTVRMDPGDMLLAYSDGLTECRNSQEEEFEVARLSAAAASVNSADANQVLFSTLGAVLDFADACPPGDDLTLLVVRRCEPKMAKHSSIANKGYVRPRRRLSSIVRPGKFVSGEETFRTS